MKTISHYEYKSKIQNLIDKVGMDIETSIDFMNTTYKVKPLDKCLKCYKSPPLKDNSYCLSCWDIILKRLKQIN